MTCLVKPKLPEGRWLMIWSEMLKSDDLEELERFLRDVEFFERNVFDLLRAVFEFDCQVKEIVRVSNLGSARRRTGLRKIRNLAECRLDVLREAYAVFLKDARYNRIAMSVDIKEK
jgi:hypothetical protein